MYPADFEVGALLETLQKVIQLILDIGNKLINILIFRVLYKVIAKNNLTVFDAVSLIIAISTTIFTKLITRFVPPEIPNLDAKLLDGIVLDNKEVAVTPQMKLDFNIFTTALTVSVGLVKTVVNLIKFAISLANKGTGSAMKTLAGS
ncbi:hypothetical protein EYZ11_010607 [Aspergillus tanneri]|uniref:Uncharacterized protein n=1 Tax=Aspergillus tanneri TaxID=1220188 RepID=A0A4S3J5H6_9EURO|nr:hypothetical protein EYZ11_010607 [Aspergillus tanneri]